MKRAVVLVAVVLAILIGAFHGRPNAPISVASLAPASTERPPPPRVADALVYVVGAVRHPGLYHVRLPARAAAALAAAGGLLPDADPAGVNLAAYVDDGDQITVPAIGAPQPRGAKRHRGRHARHARKHRPPAALLDLNAASVEQLQTIPGIGAGLAGRIVAFREANGPFASIDELADVAGMNDRLVATASQYLTANAARR
ncbi:MAG: helix-hairpin-helix domain-containing protein [Candidatus Eremiobacteraeota bacterium]|nr:helix-hairpin-helix domain-containing protein [Candidatus Eremiobacteraeota bacterium]